ncbi:hypothetical protein [Serratia symbiotica]|uniref:hypothetical protein n=1 Tax=Serratia symbiotica TaxID=138074 RepID=UPI0013214EAB|nr:hypothetical protein [Serratia symbiotica]QTP15267.1 hypothetical protein GPZ83_0004800 [Serratia symbiotica]
MIILYVPTDNALLDIISNHPLSKDWDGSYSLATWNIRNAIRKLHPNQHVTMAALRKHLRGMALRGLLKSTNSNGNNIIWTLVVPCGGDNGEPD